MVLISNSLWVNCLLLLLALFYLAYWAITRRLAYWERRGFTNIKYELQIASFLENKSRFQLVRDLYERFKGESFVGLFHFSRPLLMVRDSDLIHKIMVKDFIHFQNRGQPTFKKDRLSHSLFSLRGQTWRALRYKLTPTFTSGKLKCMFEQISKSVDDMIEKIDKLTTEKEEVEAKSLMFEFTLDVIASCAFGVKFPTGSSDFNQFKSYVLSIFHSSLKTLIKSSIGVMSPMLADFLNLKTLPADVEGYFLELTKKTLKCRKETNIHRNDYFQLLITLKEQEDSGKDVGLTIADASEDDVIVNQMQYTGQNNQTQFTNKKLFTDDAIAANTFSFLTAGSDSVSSTISFLMFELTQHLDIQQRVQEEVDSAVTRHGGWSYETVKDMTYLDQVIQETQRMYPLISMITRWCVKPYTVPGSDLVIDEGVIIGIPVAGLHKDPQYYPDPERFDPDRFFGNNFKPNPAFLPFGDGPRICIALRFAVLEVKTCVARVMSQYSVRLSDKTPLPLKFSARAFVPVVSSGIWLRFEKRKKELV